MIKLYCLPIEAIDVDGFWYRGPKYFRWYVGTGTITCDYSLMDYGSIDFCLLVADIEQADHDFLIAQPDVYYIPDDLDTYPTALELNAFESFLEGAFIPASWLSTQDTWKTCVRTISGMFLLMQRLTAITGDSPLDWGITLNTQFQNLDQDKQDAITQAYTDLGYDTAVIRDNWTIRVLLKNSSEQWGEKPIYLGLIEI